MGSSTTETKSSSSSDTTPWAPQQPYILSGLADAKSIYDKRNAAGNYTGDFVAAPNKDQYQSFNDALGWANGAAKDFSNQQLNQGNALYNAGMATQNAATQGLANWTSTDHTQANIDKANQYASAQNVDGQVQAAMRDQYRLASENTLPTLYRQASGTGNLNSDRTALAQGVVDRGLAEKSADLSATIRSNLFNQGLAMTNNENQQNLSALGTLGTLGTNNLNMGMTGQNNGFTDYGKALGAQQAASFGLQGLNQNVIDNDKAKWMSNYSFDQNNLNDYWKIAGDVKGTHTDSTGTQTTTSTPSLGSQIGQGIGIFGSLFSDARYKVVLSDGPVGSWKGFPTYRYAYTFAPNDIHEGPMAQDIAAARPDAVSEVFGKLIIDTSVL
ncbi:hypothetical protein ACFZ8E_07485 [Methylobacterium sp. HMF5984]|uniref:hypothetical protein n=1 Tax=Methylobacterium sp. HMF5984 TaxID=3367370 RepID=UPI0038520658